MTRDKQQTQRLGTDSPARYGAYLSMVAGVALFAAGLYLLLATDRPLPLCFGLLVCGFLAELVGWYTLHRVRAAWAFACSLSGTLAVVFLFGAPKVRDALEISIALALLPSFLFGCLLMLLFLGRDDF